MISKRLQDVMQEKGWSQSELAKKINTNRVQVNRWLHEKAIPTKNSIRRIAAATGCNLEWLQVGKGEMFSVPQPEEWEDWEEQQRAEDEQMEMDEWLEEEKRRKVQQQTVSKLLAKTAVVLESDTMHHGALAGVINALYRAVRLEEKMPKPPSTGLKALQEKFSG